MMYNNKLACAIKVGGKVLREDGENVILPFGSEYSFFIKNLNTVKADVKIFIDGENVADGDSFVVQPGGTIDIERFMRKGNLAEGNRFKFIERTAGIEKHRGVGIEDGLVRIEFQFAKPMPKLDWTYHEPIYTKGSNDMLRGGSRRISNNTGDGDMLFNHSITTSATTFSANATTRSAPQNETGITTEGSISDQQFTKVASFALEDEKHVMVLHLLGETEDNRKVVAPITTKVKPVCNKCGTVGAKFDTKYCGECGTSLQIV